MEGRFATVSERLLHATGKLASGVYNFIFGHLDDLAAQRGNKDLAKRIDREWASLLREHGGQAQIPSVRRRSSFNYAIAQVVFPELFLEVTQGRGESRVRVSPRGELNQLEDLSILIRSLGDGDSRQVRADMTLAQLGSVLESNWVAIVARMRQDAHGKSLEQL
jgi:hypothetical protein